MRPRAALVAFALTAGLLLVAPAERSRGAVTCGPPSGTTLPVTLTAAGDSVRLVVGEGGAIVHATDFFTLQPCGGATVTNTDLITITGDANMNQNLIVDLSGGPFAPGSTTSGETGTPEIEFTIDLGAPGVGQDFNIFGSSGDDRITFGGNEINLNGDDDADVTVTIASIGNVGVHGSFGNDVLNAQGGEGTPAGNDFDTPIVNMRGDGGDDVLHATNAGPEFLNGGPGDDVLDGGGGDDTLLGAGENDTYRMGSAPNGADVVDEDAADDGDDGGFDVVDYRERTGDVTVNASDTVANDGEIGENDNVRGDSAGAGPVEVIRTGSGNDTVTTADGVSPPLLPFNDADTGAGDDIINGGDTVFDRITAGEGTDVLNGNGASDTLFDGPGNDTANGGPGNDTFEADPGQDVLDGGDDTDTVFYRRGTAQVNVSLDGAPNDGSAGENDNVLRTENVTTFDGNDTITGNDANNVFDTGAGNDLLRGNLGNDVLNGGDGFDTFLEGSTANGADVLNGGPDGDVAWYQRTTDTTITLDGIANDGEPGEGDNVQTENVDTGDGNDTVTGDGAANTFRTEGGTDVIFGGDGNDFIDDGPGDDTSHGEAGDDLFANDLGSDVFDGGDGTDETLYIGTADVTVTLDGLPNDGEAGEADNVQTENVSTGSGNDSVTGGPGPNVLETGAGDDQINLVDGLSETGSDCGDGNDTATIDKKKKRKRAPKDVVESCETVIKKRFRPA